MRFKSLILIKIPTGFKPKLKELEQKKSCRASVYGVTEILEKQLLGFFKFCWLLHLLGFRVVQGLIDLRREHLRFIVASFRASSCVWINQFENIASEIRIHQLSLTVEKTNKVQRWLRDGEEREVEQF
ncbi:hypothetical protein L2E82_50925 [Cichorium intybus]|nr:hypothetical protein L2E82_50925 [Cichorium intybus]